MKLFSALSAVAARGDSRRSSALVAGWTIALAIAVLWPARVLSPLDGAPLNGRAEAVLIGLVLPVLWWLDRGFLMRRPAQAAIAALLAVKLFAHVALPQHGLCARFSTAAPLTGTISTITIDEPVGTLRSWDARADWQSSEPRCSAILDGPYRSRAEFPSWFVNLLNALRPESSPGSPGNSVALDIDGYVSVADAGTLVVETGGMTVDGRVGTGRVTAGNIPLAAGTHPIRLHAMLTGEDWKLVPLWNGRDAWTAARLTVTAPGWIDRFTSRAIAIVTPAIVLLLLTAWLLSALARHAPGPALAWTIVLTAICATAGIVGRFEREVTLLLAASVIVPVARRRQNIGAAFFLVGIPWLALFVAESWPQIGRVTVYSLGDDWQMYQAAAYRIFMHGYWIQGGSPTFLFQPLYRWIAGALHVLFGDSSVGEVYWDAGCLLAAALTCFAIVRHAAGFRWGLAAAALTLATFTISSIWYLIGRGLSEISAVGWMSCAVMLLMRARLGNMPAAFAAGLFAVLMFYTRLNHLLLAVFLLACLLPTRTPAAVRELLPAIRRTRVRPAMAYAAAIALGVFLFATHTWWYAGHFSVVYGTSFEVQQTGLRVTTIASPAVWMRIGEAFAAQLSMREPAAIDPRSALVVAGVVLSVLALVQVRFVKRLPASLALLTVGTIAGSFVAHTHEYPGRMAVHVVPFAVGMSACAASQLLHAWKRRGDHAVAGAPSLAM